MRQKFTLLLKRGEALFRVLKFWREADFSLYAVCDAPVRDAGARPYVSYQTSGLVVAGGMAGPLRRQGQPLYALTRAAPVLGLEIADFGALRALADPVHTPDHLVLNVGAATGIALCLSVLPRDAPSTPPSGIGLNFGIVSVWLHRMEIADPHPESGEMRCFAFADDEQPALAPRAAPAFVQTRDGRDEFAVFGPHADSAYTLHVLGDRRPARRPAMDFRADGYSLRLADGEPHRIPFKILGPKGFVRTPDLNGLIGSISLS